MHNWLCHAYCLMDNHFHIIEETIDGYLSAGMRQLNGVYTHWHNRTHTPRLYAVSCGTIGAHLLH